jgi:hypothetical protein
MTMKPFTALFWLGLAAIAAESGAAEGDAGFSQTQICKAGIGLVMGKSPAIIKATVAGNEVRLSYIRADDGSTWKYKCKVEGSRVLWGADPGRWRTHPDDEPLFYAVTGSGASARLTIEERYQDGSSRKKTFSLGDLK